METVCQLCAKEKPLKQLVNNIEDETLNIQQKLIDCCRWNSIITNEYETLPKRICNPCYRKLEISWSFAENVAQAQIQIFSNFAEEKPLLKSIENVDINDTVVKDESLEINDVHEPNAEDTPNDFNEPLEPMGKLELALKQEDNINPSDDDDEVAAPNFEHDIPNSGISEPTLNNRPKRRTKPVLEKYQAGNSKAKDKGESKSMHKNIKAKNSKAKDKDQSSPVQKENQLRKVGQLEKPSAKRCVCDTCGKVVTGVYRFKLHLNSHTKPQKPHECQTCGKCFRAKDKLKVSNSKIKII